MFHNTQWLHEMVDDEAHGGVVEANMILQHNLQHLGTPLQHLIMTRWAAIWKTMRPNFGQEKRRTRRWICVCRGTRPNWHPCMR